MADISPQVRTFIVDHISSVAQLEVLLLMRHAHERWWSIEALDQELRTDRAWLGRVLQDLCHRGILEKSASDPPTPPTYRYSPRSAELDDLVGALAQSYLVHRVRVIETIYTKPSDAIRAFTDAFNLRKDSQRG